MTATKNEYDNVSGIRGHLKGVRYCFDYHNHLLIFSSISLTEVTEAKIAKSRNVQLLAASEQHEIGSTTGSSNLGVLHFGH